MADEGEDGQGDDGDGVGVDGAAGEGEEEGGGEEASGGEDEAELAAGEGEGSGFLGAEMVKNEEIEGGESGSEEEITHELGFDGEAGRMRKAEGMVGAAETEEGLVAGEAGEVKETLEPTDDADSSGGDEEGSEEFGAEAEGEAEGGE